MAASINTNMPAMTAQRHLGATQGLFHRTVERLSSGLRINSARDDAAGLFLSERLKNQVRGLQQASRNAQDGISFLQTAEGGLSVQHDILMRLRELAVQSSNGVMSDSDRALSIKPEADALLAELTRVAQTTKFNSVALLDGTLGGVQISGVGTAVGNNARLANTSTNATVQLATSTGLSGADITIANGIDSVWAEKVIAQPATPAAPANTPVAMVLTSTAYVAATDSATITLGQRDTANGTVGTDQTITVTGVSTINGSRLVQFTNGINVVVNKNLGAAAIANGGFAVSSNLASVDTDATSAGTIETTSVLPPGVDGLVLQVGANNQASDRLTLLNMNAITAAGLGLTGTTTGSTYSVSDNLATQSGAQNAIDIIDNAIEQVSTQRSKIGAYQNRMDYTITNLGVAAENQQAAASRITDADVAAEVSEMVRTQILSQSAMAILAQANAAPQALLSLFR